jgi:hypothetical protein
MLNFCGIVAAILKMETGRNFSMSGINSGHHTFSYFNPCEQATRIEAVEIPLLKYLASW